MDYKTAESYVTRTGEWWVYGEYHRDEDLKHCKFEKDVVELAFNKVKEIFGRRWYKEQVDKQTLHPLAGIFFPRVGTSPLEYITQLGLDLIECREIRNLNLIINRLRAATQYNAARFELEMAAYFRRLGYEVNYNPLGVDREEGPDLSVNNAKNTIYVECKIMEESEPNRYMSRMIRLVHEKLYNVKAKISIHYSNDVLDLFRGRLRNSADAIIDNIAEKITDPIREQVAKGNFEDLNIQGLAEVKLAPSNDVTGVVGERFPILSVQAEIGRIVANAIDKGIEQLRDNPGLITVNQYLGMDTDVAEGIIDAVFKSHQDLYRDLVGVMLVNWLYHELPRGLTYHHFIIENPYAKYSLSGLGFEKILSMNT